MRNAIITVGLSLLMLVAPAFAATKPQPPEPPQDPTEQLRKSTLAVYEGAQQCAWGIEVIFVFQTDVWECKFAEHFTCTATVVDQNSDDNSYTGLTAGHCFDWAKQDDYYVAETTTGKPVLHKITLLKFENDERYDYALFMFRSLEDYPVIGIKDIHTMATPDVGTKVANVNFSLGVVKGTVEGKVVSDIITGDAGGECGSCKGRYLVSIGVGPGASGSAVIDEETGMIVGIVEAVWPDTQMPTVVMPINKNFSNFVQDDSAGVAPLPEGPKPNVQDAPTKESIMRRVLRLIFELCLSKHAVIIMGLVLSMILNLFFAVRYLWETLKDMCSRTRKTSPEKRG